jgi:histone-lysine N-methyltransferase SETMAR
MSRLTGHLDLVYLGFQCLDYSSYSPGLTPSDYHLFPRLKKQLKGRHFSSDTEVIAAVETMQKLQQRPKKCTELRGEYAE